MEIYVGSRLKQLDHSSSKEVVFVTSCHIIVKPKPRIIKSFNAFNGVGIREGRFTSEEPQSSQASK